MAIENRYDFVLLFDVKDGNPNGDPDAGNLPRLDPETGRGLVTDVCLKRKIRNYVAAKHKYSRPYDIYVKEGSVLGHAHVQAFRELNIRIGEDITEPVPEELREELTEQALPDGLELQSDEDENARLSLSGSLVKKDVQEWIKEVELTEPVKKLIRSALRKVKPRRPDRSETEKGREKMCQTFYDIRTFGAVLSLKSAPNCGQVRGPVQMTFARSVDLIAALEHSITRMAVATEAESERQGGGNRTMGRKHTVPYGLYVGHGFVSSHLAAQTGFSDDDLALLWESLTSMFEHDRSAARGEMATRGLYVFKHDSQLGNAPAHALFAHIQPKRKADVSVPRDFSDYDVSIQETGLPHGVTLERKVG